MLKSYQFYLNWEDEILTFLNLINFKFFFFNRLYVIDFKDLFLYPCLSKTRILHFCEIDYHLCHLWNWMRLSAPIIKWIFNFLFFFFIWFIKSIVLLDLILSSKNLIFINLFIPIIFFASLILVINFILLFFLKGFFFVIAQIISLSLYFCFAFF